MSALTAPRDAHELDGVSTEEIVKASTYIPKGSHIGVNTSGTVQPMAKAVSGGLKSLGIALHSVAAADADGSTQRVKARAGCYVFHNSSAADEITEADIGSACYAEDDQTVAKLSTGSRPVAGRVLAIMEDGKVAVAIGQVFNPDGDLVAANNLSDVGSAETARANIGANKFSLSFEGISSKAADAEVVRWVAPRACTIVKVYTVLNAACATADATVTGKINASAITNGVVTIAYSGSAAGDVDVASPSAANVLAAGDVLNFTVGGGSTATGTFNMSVDFTY